MSRLINSGKKNLIKGSFQEETLTRILSYSGNRFGAQTRSDKAYYQAYLKKLKRAGLFAGVVEYTKDTKMRKAIVSFCRKNGYAYCISSTSHLR